MKKYILFFLILLYFGCSYMTNQNNGHIYFPEHEWDFHDLAYNQAVSCCFEFTNPGRDPLIIQNVKTSCGCTVASWTKHPINKGKSGEIVVNYTADYPGVFYKEITVFYNGIDSPEKLKIKGLVRSPANSIKAE